MTCTNPGFGKASMHQLYGKVIFVRLRILQVFFFQTFPREQAKSVNQCNRCKTNLFRYKLSARMKSDKFVCTLNVILFLVFPCWF